MRLRGKILIELMDQAKPASMVSYGINESEDIVLSSLHRMHHLGIVQPVAIGPGLWDLIELFWDLTTHAREHKEIVSRCFGCRMREIYLAANEALFE